MEQIKFVYPSARRDVVVRAHIGVVGSGDLEILVEPSTTDGAEVFITTSVKGFQSTWQAVMDRFFSSFDGAVRIEINDAGATPGTVLLRLQQAAEVVGL